MQTITKIFEFDAMHRVMHERFKCFNVHGHRYVVEATFEFNPNKLLEEDENIGYAIDFKELKRIAGGWIDEFYDHGSILNPKDTILIDACQQLDSKLWLMSLNGADNYCNPSAENIAKEIYIALRMLFKYRSNIDTKHIRLFETPTCYTDCDSGSLAVNEFNNWSEINESRINDFLERNKPEEYDVRRCK